MHHLGTIQRKESLMRIRKTLFGYVPAPRGMSGLGCPYCKRYFSVADEDKMSMENSMCECGFRMSGLQSLTLSVLPTSMKFLDKATVRSTSWFHITARQDWHEQVLAAGDGDDTLMVHLGTLESAMRRGIDVVNNLPPSSDKCLTLHEVRLNPKAPIAFRLMRDKVVSFPRNVRFAKKARGYRSKGVTRYVNLYEIAGSISLIVNARAFEVVSSRPVSLDDVFDFATEAAHQAQLASVSNP